ncbi:Uncharacterized protein dnm_011950 [Desulfonema magnum]|uniref:Uncharacterized protein n=1 Tax=Desulfonema magnum TaxID=45655 RepID=A0A975BH53_9BACT|nr:Uncharacterized protein dnm_011950 [Desulfonema magnum]
MSGGETRLFPLSEKHHSRKKARFLLREDIKNLWLGTYLSFQGVLCAKNF